MPSFLGQRLWTFWPSGREGYETKTGGFGSGATNVLRAAATDVANLVVDASGKLGMGAARTALSLVALGASKEQANKKLASKDCRR